MSDRIRVSPSGGVLVEIPSELVRKAMGAADLVPRPEVTSLVPLAEVELRYVRHVLACVDGNRSHAAKVLGISRRALYRYLTKLEAANTAAPIITAITEVA